MNSSERVRVVAARLIADGVPISRGTLRQGGCCGSDSVLGDMLNELIDDGIIRREQLNTRHPRHPGRRPAPSSRSPREEERVELPPPRRFEMQPQTKPEPSVWEWARSAYWNERRRAMYRRGLA